MKKKHMTKAQALAIYKAENKEFIQESKDTDKILLITDWNMYVDSLHRDGSISENQRLNWSNPFEYRRDK